MVFSSKIYRLLERVDPGIREVLIAILEEMERQREQWEQSVTKTEFNSLKEIVGELAEAQKRTEERISRLEKVVEELAEAQKRTEERVEELSQAQRKTELEIQKLTGELALVKERLEGLSNSVGYSLENMAYKALPPLLKKDLSLELTTPLIRKYLTLPKGKLFQANIYGLGRRDGKDVIILGECKVRPSKKEVRRFLSQVKRFSEAEGTEVVPLIVAHDFPPEMEKYLKELGIKYYWSYELE